MSAAVVILESVACIKFSSTSVISIGPGEANNLTGGKSFDGIIVSLGNAAGGGPGLGIAWGENAAPTNPAVPGSFSMRSDYLGLLGPFGDTPRPYALPGSMQYLKLICDDASAEVVVNLVKLGR